MPALGLNLPPRGMAALHGSLIALCAVLLVLPRLRVLSPLLFLTLSLLLASYSLRLSNHLIAAWFMGLLLCLDLLFQSPGLRGLAPTPFFLSGVQIVVGLTYALAFLHKLNPEYFSPEMSCGSYLGCEYLEHRVNIRAPGLLKIQGFLSIYAILALEGVIPLLFLFPATRPLGILLAVLLHLPLGFLVHVHFAAVMYAGLTAFVAPTDWPRVLASAFALSRTKLILLFLLGLYLGHRFGSYGYKRHLPAYLHQLFWRLFPLCFCRQPDSAARWAAADHVRLGRGGSARAAARPDGSLCLERPGAVSRPQNQLQLRHVQQPAPDPWCHLLWRAAWRPLHARYVRIETIEGLPHFAGGNWGDTLGPALERLNQPDQWQYSEYFFHDALCLLCHADDAPVIRVVYAVGGRRHEVQDYAKAVAAHRPRYLRLGLFPYALPLDPTVRHCD